MRKRVSEPLVSVVMTAYNAAEFVAQAVESICQQTYTKWELIIVDDGSTDGTKKILRSFAKNNPQISVINYPKNRGASHASNMGLSKVRGQFIARMDSDDIALPDRLAKQVLFLQTHPGVIMVGGQCELIDRKGKKIGMKYFPTEHGQIYSALYEYNPIQHPSLMINTQLLGSQAITYHPEVLLAHDLEIVFKLAQYGTLANLAEPVLQYRIHSDSLSLKHPKETFKHTLKVRAMANAHYGYTPSLRGSVIHSLQKIVMMILPSFVVYPLFRLLRMSKTNNIKTSLSPASAILLGLFAR